MKFKYILPVLIGAVAACLIGGTCYGLWVFNTDKTASTEIGFDADGDSNIKIDDIAENYYFASDTRESNFYNVYFFSQPRAAQYETSSNTPVEEYDKETKKNSFSYHNAYRILGNKN